MAVDVDSTASANSNSGVTSLTWSHAVGASAASRYMLVAVGTNGAAASGVTYAGVAMDFLGDTRETPTGYRLSFWGLKQPGTGTNNVVVTLPSTVVIVGGSICFTGVDQVNPTGTYAGAPDQGTHTQITLASDADEMAAVATIWNQSAGAATATDMVGQTSRWTQQASGNFIRGVGSTAPGAASVTVGYDYSATTNVVVAAITIKPALTPAKGTISRVVVPLSRFDKRRLMLLTQGWQQGIGEPVVTLPSDFFTYSSMG